MRLVRGLLVIGLLACPAIGLKAQLSPFYDPGWLYRACDPANPNFWYRTDCVPMNGYEGYFSSPSQIYYRKICKQRFHGLNRLSGIADFRRAYALRGPKAMEGMKLGHGYTLHAINTRGSHGQPATSLEARGAGGGYFLGVVNQDGHFESAVRSSGGESTLRGAVSGTTMAGAGIGSPSTGWRGGFHGVNSGGGYHGGSGMGGGGGGYHGGGGGGMGGGGGHAGGGGMGGGGGHAGGGGGGHR